ncbi:FYVE finger-containing protein [Phytophthora cinnamomi]|uniref:FYVE finger-containing protein n=1 Tax=Phytophthora cinnamomi TaxID=4785 RepID=UPI00355961FE|nr:FYVE finger-containing protein [Phytophthora cinnamomi]
MSDPFFDEDDGEFDDLYGNPPPAAPSPSRPQKPRNSPPSAAQPSTPGGRPSTRSPAGSSSVVSRSYARDRAGSAASNATDLAASGKQDKRRRRHGKARRKDSQELFDVQWQSDVAVSKCGLCRADFSLVRRKHHCRHCGRVMCSDCSSFLFFEFSHRKHRVCATCNNQLLAEQDAYDREARAGGAQQRDTASNLFDDSSDDGRPSAAEVTPASSTPGAQQTDLRSSLANAFTPKHNGDDEKARKKQEKKERKERKKREKLEKTGTAVPIETMKVSRRQADGVEEKPTTNGAALFDGADDDWFTDVPDQRTRARGSGAGRDEEGSGSKGPGWGDRVNDTYTITPATEQPSVLVPMTGSTLTAGITGKGYISDQFRYDDVGGPGLGHDDDLSVEMPRPKQQATTTTYANHSVEPSRLTAGITAKGYISDQFRYDDTFDHEREDVGSEDDDRGSSPDEDGGFSFEIKAPKKRTSVLDDQTGSSVSEHVELSSPSPSSSADDNLELGKYVTSSVPSSTAPSVDGSVDDPEDVSVDDESVLGKVESQAFDTDWNQMQVKEKERKKRLQAKQRQAQRDKVLRKQGTSAKSLTGSSTPHGSSKSKSKTGKKKKKEKENDTAESSHHKKSGSSRKHRHREKGDADGAVPSDPPRSLTEL